MIMLQGLMVAEGEVTGFDLEKKKIEVCTKKGEWKIILTPIILTPIILTSMVMMIVTRDCSGKLKFKKEKRVKKPLKIACNGQYQ